MKYTGRWTVRGLPGGVQRVHPLVQAQGAPGPLLLVGALNLGTPWWAPGTGTHR
jgi:hypothetical protein